MSQEFFHNKFLILLPVLLPILFLIHKELIVKNLWLPKTNKNKQSGNQQFFLSTLESLVHSIATTPKASEENKTEVTVTVSKSYWKQKLL